MTSQSFDAARDAVTRIVRDHWKLFLIEGIILVILGLLAVAVPVVAGLAVTILFGWLFLISGIVGLITTFAMRQSPGFWWSLLSGVLGVVVGGWLLVQPELGLASLTYLLIAFFIIEGVATIMFALEHRAALSGRWGVDACKWDCRSVSSWGNPDRTTGGRRLGAGLDRRDQHGVRRRFDDRNGARRARREPLVNCASYTNLHGLD